MRVTNYFLNQNSKMLGFILKSLQVHVFRKMRKSILVFFAMKLPLFEM